uniref:hypothetical protein n=1 Tax=Lachnoclostridium phocaeense TaxID=1871021 RepID=UPI0026DCCD1E|nr:hypothetical protein [Lachnoclostridium phocaeense]
MGNSRKLWQELAEDKNHETEHDMDALERELNLKDIGSGTDIKEQTEKEELDTDRIDRDSNHLKVEEFDDEYNDTDMDYDPV